MSKKGGEILNNLWSRVDQAGYDTMIKEAFGRLPTSIQKKFIEDILDEDAWDLDGKPNEEDIRAYRRWLEPDEDSK